MTNCPGLRILSLSLNGCPWGRFGVTQISEKLSSPGAGVRSCRGRNAERQNVQKSKNVAGVRYWKAVVGGLGMQTYCLLLLAKVSSRP